MSGMWGGCVGCGVCVWYLCVCLCAVCAVCVCDSDGARTKPTGTPCSVAAAPAPRGAERPLEGRPFPGGEHSLVGSGSQPPSAALRPGAAVQGRLSSAS